MIEIRLRKIGNALGVILPDDVIAWLQATEGASLYLIEAPDGGYRLVPYGPTVATKMRKAEDIMRRYRDALTVLSK